ncbi:leucine Rich Repeat family protein [Stagonosporopsis vannaccii]|nr:leucine Rich Repeat family protein [Stagonosporopsis vannaccii]
MENDTVPPSSPPHAIATNPPSSPFFEPQRYGAFSPKSSSPPPLFSSDDSGETLDITNYESPRIFKNKRKGAWYETDNGDSTQNTPEPKKTKISRNYDSGIYMMSDNSDGSVDPLPEHKSPFPFATEAPEEDEPEPMSMTEAAFCSALRVGMDRNCQDYDFQGLDLGDDDIKQIGDLNSVIKNLPDPGNDLPTEGQYRSMVPELYINLSQNSLRRMTPSLFNLQHLTSLVLRDNRIDELPPQISRLRNLQELDLSLNKLQYLPFELLEMLAPHGKLEHLTTLGNPLLERVSQSRYRKLDEHITFTTSTQNIYPRLQDNTDHEALVWHIRYVESMENFLDAVESKYAAGLEKADERIFGHHSLTRIAADTPSPRYIARTLVSYFDQAGQLVKGSPARPSPSRNDYPIIVETNEGAFGVPANPIFAPPTSSRIPSLLTKSIHTALANISVIETKERLGDPVPFDAAAIFKQATYNDANAGFGYFQQCHICKKDYIVARAEWVEFWSTSFTVFYPFKVKVCSWGCVPPEMTRRPEKELEW